MALHLVRHGGRCRARACPAREWELDPAGFDDVWALRESGRLPAPGGVVLLPEPKATQTAQLLTESDVGVLDDLREQDRGSGVWIDDFAAAGAARVRPPRRAGVLTGAEPWRPPRQRLVAADRGCCVPLVLVALVVPIALIVDAAAPDARGTTWPSAWSSRLVVVGVAALVLVDDDRARGLTNRTRRAPGARMGPDV